MYNSTSLFSGQDYFKDLDNKIEGASPLLLHLSRLNLNRTHPINGPI